MTAAARLGRNLLLRDGTGTAATVVAAMRNTKFTIAGQSVDVTDKDSPGQYRELLAGAGVSSVSVSASGLLHGNTQGHVFANRALSRSISNYRLEFDNGDTLEGPFQIVSFEATGQYQGEQTYDLTLESAGSMTLGTV